MKSKLLVILMLISLHAYSQLFSCKDAKISWVKDDLIGTCKFSHPDFDPANIINIEHGYSNTKAGFYHCYYFETELCDATTCATCTVDEIFNLMISSKKYIAPSSENVAVVNCGVSILLNNNPIITTVHPTAHSIVNYTLKIETKSGITEHDLHPGKIQRTIFKRGNSIYVGTIGDGNTWLKLFNGPVGWVLWYKADTRLKNAIKCGATSSTLILFDVSGSMGQNNKWQSAKQSALSALSSIRAQASAANIKPSISIRAFDGDCTADPTREVIGFTTDLTAVENAINNKVPPPGGGTPLPQSIKVSEDKLNTFLNANGIKKGKLIVLTDGVSTCGSLRPQGVYGSGQQQTQATPTTAKSVILPMNYYAVGFDIAPGSEAERDLQYLVQQNGGKYMNAKNATELTDAFYIFNRVYIPKLAPAVKPADESDKALFEEGITLIDNEAYDKALENYQQYSKGNPGDFNGIYNLALMNEANELYKAAVKNYEAYLQLNSTAPDKIFVTDILQKLRERVQRYFAYHKQVVKSDMEFLDMHFKKIQNGESIALAREFIGFLREKYNYYKNLPAIVELEDRNFKTNANEVFKGLKECVDTINRNPHVWDRDATPVLSRTYLNMERLLNSF